MKPIGKQHLIVPKCHFEYINALDRVARYQKEQQQKLIGGNAPIPGINKQAIDFIHLRKGEVPADRLYDIDKIVRQRMLQGRFGIDYSESLNYQIYKWNKH